MSAIAGLVFADGRDVGAILPRKMALSTPRPHPEQSLIWQDGCAAFVRFPHATTVEAIREAPPRPSAVSGSVLCFDGRLDNRAALFTILGDRNAELRDAPDGDIALALFDQLGERFLQELVGDFALAIWQPHIRRLFCARSPTGWRPLLWTCDRGMLAFATEPATLIKGLDLAPRLNEGLVGEILSTRFVSSTDTFWQGVYRLAPGSALDFQNGIPRIRRWYDEAYEDLSRLSDGDHVERFNHLFDQALIACTRSNRPVAAHLSGGLDSSSVFARALKLRRVGTIDREIGAISVRYPGQPQDETAWSAAVEDHLGISARVVGDMPFNIDAARDWCADTLHLPIRPNTMGPTQSVCTLMQDLDERVLLTGEGGDDWMNGSRAHWPDLLLGGRWGRLLREGLSSLPDHSLAQNLRTLASASIGPILSKTRRGRLKHPFLELDAAMPTWISADWAARIGLEDRWRDAAPAVDFPNFTQMPRRAVIAQAYRELIFDPIKTKTAQHGVEQRHPLHDLRLVRFFMGAAGGMLLRSGERKYLLREAMRETLPEIVRTRRSKSHFSAPIIDALAQAFDRRPPEEMQLVQIGWVDGMAIKRLFDEHRQWRRSGCDGGPPNRALAGLWFCFAVDLWLENAFKL